MIQFLNAWNGYEQMQVATLSAPEEARLIGLGLARNFVAGTTDQQSGRNASLSALQVAGGAVGVMGVTDAGQPVLPTGEPFALSGPSYLWANRPAATAANAGSVIRIADVGATAAGSLWISDGAAWSPVQPIVLAAATGSVATPLASVSAVGKFALPDGRMVTGGSVVLPAGLLRAGLVVRVTAKTRHLGTAGAWRADVRMGTLNTSTDNAIGAVTGAATNDQNVAQDCEAAIVSATSFTVTGFAVPNSPGTGAFTDKASNFNTASTNYVGLYIGTLTAADTVALITYRVELLGA